MGGRLSDIIDIHTHLGDLLYPNGGELITRKRVRKNVFLDPLAVKERLAWSAPIRVPFPLPSRLVVLSGQVRNATGTVENMRRAMDKAGVDQCVALPIPPNVTFEDLLRAQELDDGVLAFTGLDFSRWEEADSIFANDVSRGAKGLKIHPILQKVPIDSPKTYAAVEAFAPFELPILFHAGECDYYWKGGEKSHSCPEYGDIAGLEPLVRAFPNVNFIVGHAGLGRVDEVIERFSQSPNVYVDMSFQTPEKVVRLIETLGVERVLYASDWPWGDMGRSISVVEKACAEDSMAARRVLSENAASLLRL